MKKNLYSLCGLVLVAILIFNSCFISKAEEPSGEENTIIMTDDLALSLAQNFAKSTNNIDLTALNPVKFYDSTGQAIGYIVEYYQNNIPHGYVIFDSRLDDLICEYSFEENSVSPYATCCQKCNVRSSIDSKIYKLDALTYGIKNSNEKLVTNSNKILDAPDSLENARSKDPSTWNDIFINSIFPEYTVVDVGHLPSFIALPESYYEQNTGHYACVVTALYHCAMFYGCVNGNTNTIRDEYMELWDLTGTTQIDQESQNGIIYGTTNYNSSPAGFVTFCARRGVSLSSSIIANPTMETFKNCINSGNIANLSTGIYTNDGYKGHQMTVEGYTQLKNVSTGNIVDTVMVADGWFSNVRYVNLEFPNYTRLHAILFSR